MFRDVLSDNKTNKNPVGCAWAEHDPGPFTFCARKTTIWKEIYPAAMACWPPNAVLHPALLNRKTQLPHAVPLVSNTNTVSLIFRKMEKKNINYRVYIYLTNVKGFFLFMCESCESKILFFSWFTVDILFISRSVNAWLNRVTFPVYVKCVWARGVCCVDFTNSMNDDFICELKCLEI